MNNNYNPFIIRPTNQECNDFIITIGQHLATEQHFTSREEAEEYMKEPKWDMIIAMLGVLESTRETKTVINNGINKTIKK